MGPALPCNVTSQGLALPLLTSPIVSGGQSKVGTDQGTPKLGRPEAVSFAGFSGGDRETGTSRGSLQHSHPGHYWSEI